MNMEMHLLLRQNKHHMVLEGIMNFELDFVCFRMQRRCFNYRKTGVTLVAFKWLPEGSSLICGINT